MAPTTASSSYASMMRDGQACNNNSGQKLLVQRYLTNCRSLYSCIHCRTHLANHDDLVSRSFQGNRGRAYLFNSVINIICGPAVQRELNTGSHAVADIFCSNCDKTLGWKYEKAFVETQKYKEGKYIIELEHVVRENRHLELDKGEIFFGRNKRNRSSSSSSSSQSFNNRKQGSLTPPSSSSSSSSSSSPPSNQWSSSLATSTTNSSSPNEEVEGDDEELMFPFYDDLCGGRSSYPSNLSSSHHNRMRRSLYLDSTPYDWKYSAISSSIQSPFCSEYKTISSSSTSKNLASSPDSAYSSTPDHVISDSYHIKDNLNDSNNNETNNNSQNGRKDCQKCLNNSIAQDDHNGEEEKKDETQFKFEADKPETPAELSNHSEPQNDVAEQSYNHTVPNISNNAHSSSQSSETIHIDSDQPTSSPSCFSSKLLSDVIIDDINYAYEKDEDSSRNNSRKASSSSTLSIDDEKFYDCLTDHDVSKPMVRSDCPRTTSETSK